MGTQGHQQIEDHTHAGKIWARKAAVGQIRVDQRRGSRQFGSGQVMIGDQHGDTVRIGLAHPLQAGDAVVHGDDQIRTALARP